MREELTRLSAVLARDRLRPVLVDVGASGGPPPVWAPIASQAVYVGFDPDAREMRQDPGGGFLQMLIVNRAVMAGDEGSVRFYFTESPHCSSTLPPAAASLADYTFAPLFQVVRQGTVDTISLDRVIDRYSLGAIDWLKLDTQGTDLRIFQSLGADLRARVLAVDIEPGLIDAYEGEDLFVDVHRALCLEGFWLSNLNIGGAVRLKSATVRALSECHPGVDARSIERRVRRSPAWCEARYLRTVDEMSGAKAERREYLLLAIFSIMDQQWGYAFEVLSAAERRFGADETAAELKRVCVHELSEPPAGVLRALARRAVPAPVKRRIHQFLRP